MKFIFFKQSIVFYFFTVALCAEAIAVPLSEAKEKIFQETQKIKKCFSAKEKSEALYRLSLAYLEDQANEKAYEAFLEALSLIKDLKNVSMDPEESVLFSQALDHYLSLSATDPFAAANNLIRHYEDHIKIHKDYYHLKMLLSAAYGNIGDIKGFLQTFYEVYPFISQHYLSYKAQGIVWLRLSQQANDLEKKEKYRNSAISFLKEALNKYSADPSIYKTLLFLGKENENLFLINEVLKASVVSQVKIPRNDVFFFVKEAADLEEYELAQELIDSAKKHYEYSRALIAAQEFLDQQNKGQ